MAHNAHSIPWKLVAKNFTLQTEDRYHAGMKLPTPEQIKRGDELFQEIFTKGRDFFDPELSAWRKDYPKLQEGEVEHRVVDGRCTVTDLRPRFEVNQAAELEEFVVMFAKTLEQDIETEVKNRGPLPEAPGLDEVVLDERLVAKLNPIIHQICAGNDDFNRTCPRVTKLKYPRTRVPSTACEPGSQTCECLLQPEDCQMRAFTRGFDYSDCYKFMEEQHEMYLASEILKMLLVLGETDTLLKICAHPDVNIMDWQYLQECQCMAPMIGWSVVLDSALASYFVLNILYCYPELWDSARGRTEKLEYRSTAVYQRRLKNVTAWQDLGGSIKAPHRIFYGVADDIWNKPELGTYFGRDVTFGSEGKEKIYGVLPIEKYMKLDERVYSQASSEYVQEVQSILMTKGLPVELALGIVKNAHQGPFDGHQLYVPHDPLHPSNTKGLDKYLGYCWDLLVQVGVVAQSHNDPVDWKRQVKECVDNSWPDADTNLRTGKGPDSPYYRGTALFT